MNNKENYLAVLRGEQPERVPVLVPGGNSGPPTVMMFSPILLSHQYTDPGPSKDVWGVTYVPVEDAGGAKVPEPGNHVITDITKWRDIIHAPDISGIDWEALAKKDLETINREETAVNYGAMCNPFLTLMALMGFEEGLLAMCEEPEEVYALLEYITDFCIEISEKCIDYYQPDVYAMCDDIAAWLNPFISLSMYREVIKPLHVKLAKLANDRGIPIDMHCCGHCEIFIDDWREFGVVSWNPAQTCNDLKKIKETYGNSLVITGGWDAQGELLERDVSEEVVKRSVYEAFDRCAPGGGYVFSGGFLGAVGDPVIAKKNKWVAEAATEYAEKFYK